MTLICDPRDSYFVNSTETKKGKRKKRYVPHEAAARFKPTEDWSKDKALEMFNASTYPFSVDMIHYEDCIEGMRGMSKESVDVVVADPPFGISFTGKEAVYNRDDSFVVDGYHEVDEEYESFTKKWIAEIPRILK